MLQGQSLSKSTCLFLSCHSEPTGSTSEILDITKKGFPSTKVTNSINTRSSSVWHGPFNATKASSTPSGRPTPQKLQTPVVVVVHGLPCCSGTKDFNHGERSLGEQIVARIGGVDHHRHSPIRRAACSGTSCLRSPNVTPVGGDQTAWMLPYIFELDIPQRL